MSDAHHAHEHEGPHSGPIKTPKQLIMAVFFAFVVPIVAIVLLVMYVGAEKQPNAGSDSASAEATARRLHPIGSVEVKDLSDPGALKTGEQVFAAQCSACHAAGVAGAPKLGDTAAWAPRLGQGYDTLLLHALKGKGNMGPQGGGDFTDLEIGRAVVFMANKGGAKFEEPKAVAASASAATTPTPAAAPAGSAPATVVAAATTATTPAPAAAAAAKPGAAPPLYEQTCAVCHAAGVAGAPKLGDKAAWAPRLAQGIDGLVASAIKGKNAMPPKGGSNASPEELKAVVAYMVAAVK
jgi:cytochrome c5